MVTRCRNAKRCYGNESFGSYAIGYAVPAVHTELMQAVASIVLENVAVNDTHDTHDTYDTVARALHAQKFCQTTETFERDSYAAVHVRCGDFLHTNKHRYEFLTYSWFDSWLPFVVRNEKVTDILILGNRNEHSKGRHSEEGGICEGIMQTLKDHLKNITGGTGINVVLVGEKEGNMLGDLVCMLQSKVFFAFTPSSSFSHAIALLHINGPAFIPWPAVDANITTTTATTTSTTVTTNTATDQLRVVEPKDTAESIESSMEKGYRIPFAPIRYHRYYHLVVYYEKSQVQSHADLFNSNYSYDSVV